MAYIQPNSDVYLFTNVKLDSAYENTIYFANKAAQEAYFFNSGKVLQHLTAISYNRTRKDSIKVKLPVGTVAQATYMAFRNTSYENKWFYCFIDDFNYVNDNNTEIFYTIDLIQTWFIGDCSLNQCYVEREHAVDDTIGSNRVPEPIGSDIYRYTEKWKCTEMEEYSVIISASLAEDTSIASDEYYRQGMFNGLDVKVEPLTDATDAAVIMNELQDMLGDGNYVDPDQGYTDRQQVVSLIMFPSAFTHEASNGKPSKIYSSSIYKNQRTNVDGYVPKNKKLFTAPYKLLFLTTGTGNGITLDYDDFTNTDTITFKLWGVCSGSGEVICVPQWYKGVEDNFDYKLTINGFPQCAYTLDSYRAWVAGGGDKYQKLGLISGIGEGIQQLFKLGFTMAMGNSAIGQAAQNVMNATQAGSSIGQSVSAVDAYERTVQGVQQKNAQAGMQAGIGVGSAIYNTGVNYMQTQYEMGNRVNVPVGENSASCLVANRDLNFRCYELNVCAADAKRIDDFFSMFGYATKLVKVPNINQRPQWNYVKTAGCSISGNIPASIRTQICMLFDKGLRFWNNGDNIGNYALNNNL